MPRRKEQAAGYMVKARSIPELVTIVSDRRSWGMRIGLIAGVFDLMHVGHLYLADHAVDRVDLLVVALYSDRLSSNLRGDMRPLQTASDRAVIIEGMWWSDYVVEIDRLPAGLIRELCPHLYLCGDDHLSEQPDAGAASAAGCAIEVIPCLPNHSTIRLIERIEKGIASDAG